jgi:hypothetical protein
MLVLGRVHIVAQGVSRLPELGFESKLVGGFLDFFLARIGIFTGASRGM